MTNSMLGLAPTYLDTSVRAPQAENLVKQLRQYVVAQEEAVDALGDAYQTYLAGLTLPGRPLGNFLFLGPTGTGKTRIVEACAEILLKDPRSVVKIDCAEFQHSHEIAKLIGSPPGYLGHRETKALLSQEVLNQFHTETTKISFVLFDEIEKGSDALWNLLLGILDKATLTLGDNRKVDFSRCFVIMTANLGSTEMAKANTDFGFGGAQVVSAEAKRKRNTKIGQKAAKGRFTAEFFNRLDKVVTFNPLDETAIGEILELELSALQRSLYSARADNPQLVVSDEAKAFLKEKGFDETYGARHLKRAIQQHLVQPLANLIGSGQVRGGQRIKVDCGASRLLFSRL